MNIGSNYKLIRQIGKGSFGEVYLVSNYTNEEYACKVERIGTKNRLKNEAFIYKRFAKKKITCVPSIYKYCETEQYNLLLMQLLGKSLDTIFIERGNKLDIGTVMKIGISIISILEKIHRIGIIHRDIKPNNFMFGLDNYANDLYIMDFGLSKRWYNNQQHIDLKCGRSMIGTVRYASINIHNGIEPSRRDDMISVGYMLIYFINGSLPWQGLRKKTKAGSFDEIGKHKMLYDTNDLCKNMPECFYQYMSYVYNLEFTEKPDYEYLRNLFISSALQYNIKLQYYWEK